VNIGKVSPTRSSLKQTFLEFVKDLLNIVKEESHKRMVDDEEMSHRTKDKANLQWYFRGYIESLKVFLEEFWDRIQREDAWKASPGQSVLRDKNAYLSRSRIAG